MSWCVSGTRAPAPDLEQQVDVLLFLGRNERAGVGAFDPDKDREEIRLPQQPKQLVIVCEIDRCLRRELERIAARLEPARQLGQKLLQCLLVADEIIVDEVDMAAIAEPANVIAITCVAASVQLKKSLL